ncbi:MAG: (Fe-S)-binding protein [Desulfobacterales bacterium]|nr:(Fe-S)-binding protein [Desulfobacterales bacterium]
MTDIRAIARLMRELEDQLALCMRCGMCQAVCPVYSDTGKEADVARGKIVLLDGLVHELFKDPKGVAERLNRCLLCGSCAANCPSGVKVLDIFLKARAILTGFMGLSPAKRLILRGMLSRPELFDRVTEWAGRFQKIFTRPANEVIGTSCARIASPLLGGRHFRPLAPKAFHQKTPSKDTAAGSSGKRAAFFVGCLIDKIFPNIAEASMTVLENCGVGIYLPDGQGCCGIPALSSGDRKTFFRLLHHNLALFEAAQTDVMLTACATCTSTIKKVWPVMVADQPETLRRRVEQIAEKTTDINAFVAPLIDPAKLTAPPRKPPMVVTYHDPCHLKKSLGIFAEPRRLLQAAPGCRLAEMAEPDACCGMGGSFNLQYYEISSRIGRLKRDRIVATGASAVTTGCPACMLQISDMLSRSGNSVRVCHPIEIIAEAMDPS